MASFHIAIEKPEEIIPRLGKKELHWKEGRSAAELSTLWVRTNGIPRSVAEVLDQAPEWRDAKLLDGIFERETNLPGRGNPSQTDLLAIVRLADGNAILGVEGKVDEPFGKLVVEWLEGESAGNKRSDEERERSKKNRKQRLDDLCATLSIDPNGVGNLYYQLIHRTCASIYEAMRFGYNRAVMLVHSFAEKPAPLAMPPCFEDFAAFSRAVGMPMAVPGSISSPKRCADVDLRLAWVSERPSP